MDRRTENSRTIHSELNRISSILPGLVDTQVFEVCVPDFTNPNKPTTLNQKLEQLAIELEIPLHIDENHIDPIARSVLLEVFYGLNLAFYQRIQSEARYDDFNINPFMVKLSITRYQAEIFGAVNNSILQIKKETRRRERLGIPDRFYSAYERYEKYIRQIEEYPIQNQTIELP